MAALDGLGQVRVEPAFAGNGPWPGSASGRSPDPRRRQPLLARVAALGYTDAFLVPARARAVRRW